MDEEETKGKEEEKAAPGTEQSAAGDNEKGDKPKADEEVKRINVDTERIKKAIAENENAKARAKLGGVALAEKPAVKKELSDAEYYDKNR